MERLFQLSCFLCALFIICSTEVQHDFSKNVEIPQQVYNIDALLKETFANIKSSHQNKDPYPYFKLSSDQDFLLTAVGRLGLLQISTNSTKCASDLNYTIQSLYSKENWAFKMLDSWGKPESGILRGNIYWLGDFTQCMQVYAPKNSESGDFHGQYCGLTYSGGNSSDGPMSSPVMALCLPDSCSPSEFFDFFEPENSDGSKNNSTPPFQLTCQQRERHMSGPAKAVVALLCMFGILAIAGSSITVFKYFMEIINQEKRSAIIGNNLAIDLTEDSKDPIKNVEVDETSQEGSSRSSVKNLGIMKSCEPFLECFCVFKNGAKLLNTKTGEGELVCIHGIRFLSMSWVLLGHTYMFGVLQMRNSIGLLDIVKNWPFQILLQAFYSVDSFFVLSGFLLTYLCMQELTKNGRINWPYFYIHRYLRLTPVYMIVLAFHATVYLHLGSGPFWPQYDVDPICKKHWWANVLYVNNFKSQTTSCMGWSWYLANDMQFFVISPIIIITLWKWPKVGFSILATLTCVCWIANFALTYHYDLIAGMASTLSQPSADVLSIFNQYGKYYDKVYVKPYTRISAYLVGILTGYILFTRKKSGSPRHSLITLSVGWMIATTITLACTYGLYRQDPGLVGRSFFNTFSHTTWAIGLCWVIYVCLVDQGGIVNDILSMKFMIPLSRLTYVAYLIHPIIMNGYYANLKATIEGTHLTMVLLFFGFMVLTYALALPVALVLESPVIVLEKLIRKKFSKRH